MDGNERSKGARVGDPRLIYGARLFPDEQIQSYRSIHHNFPTRLIRRGGDARIFEFGYDPLDFDGLKISTGQGVFTLYDYYIRNSLTALMIVKDDTIVFERYDHGNDRATRWMSMSIAKSISATLLGAALQDGFIDSVDDPLTKYLPVLEKGGYRDVSIRHLLQMSSGVKWNETHTDPHSERHVMLELQIRQRPGEILEFLSGLPKLAPSGERWNYSTGETHVLGALLRAATGETLSDYLSRKIWSRAGMEADAHWWLESPDGLEVAGSGVAATAHDYARFGRFVMNNGVIEGEPVLPDWWMKEATAPRTIGGETVDYGFMWWPVRAPAGASYGDGYSARGIFGQYLYINPGARVMALVWSARAQPRFSEAIRDNDFFHAVMEHLT